MEATLYYKAAEDRYVLAFKGTTRFPEDWRANVGQLWSQGTTKQYTDAIDIGKRMRTKYQAWAAGGRFTFTGHSLGGGLASAATLATFWDEHAPGAPGVPAVTFNAAGISTNSRLLPGVPRDQFPMQHVTSYYVRGEILTLLQDGEQLPPLPVVGDISGLSRWVHEKFDPRRPGRIVPLNGPASRSALQLHGMDSVLIAMQVKKPDA